MASARQTPFTITRRALLKGSLAAGGSLLAAPLLFRGGEALADDFIRTPIRFTPFTRELPVPETLQPVARFATRCVFEPPAVASATKFYVITQRRGMAEIIPGVQTEIWGYNGLYPGPTIRARFNEPAVVRQVNNLETEVSVHLHGGHTPSDSDGFPNDFIFPGQSKDYCYPNGAPDNDVAEVPSTMWYHDHAEDITGPNVYMGLAAYYLVTDALEDGLVASNVLPRAEFDVPLVLQDKAFRADGSLVFDNFDHDGFLGDVFVANGKAQPFFRVQRRKYRFRILDGANARFWLLRLSSGAPFLQIANDSWLLPQAILRDRILLSNAERADVVVDFRDAPAEVFLENILVQPDGRGPTGDLAEPEVQIPGTPLVKFVVEGPAVRNDATVAPGTPLRPHTAIRADEIVATRRFRFERGNGAWMINGRFFDPDRAEALPRLGTAERWILENGGGGWWHPIHMHLEAHQVQRFNGARPALVNSFKKDTTLLGPGDEAEVFMKFRTFPGRFVFHCHNTEHEDMRMMFRFDVVG
jgi:FtsP/CotA-like multicopper oxidase with cupredoxin domain